MHCTLEASLGRVGRRSCSVSIVAVVHCEGIDWGGMTMAREDCEEIRRFGIGFGWEWFC